MNIEDVKIGQKVELNYRAFEVLKKLADNVVEIKPYGLPGPGFKVICGVLVDFKEEDWPPLNTINTLVSQITIGSIVKLKSGGPKMTAVSIINRKPGDTIFIDDKEYKVIEDRDFAICQWFIDNRDQSNGIFPLEALELVVDKPRENKPFTWIDYLKNPPAEGEVVLAITSGSSGVKIIVGWKNEIFFRLTTTGKPYDEEISHWYPIPKNILSQKNDFI